jgi:hypothetical protein
VRRITVPVAWKTASKEEVKFDPRSRIRNRKSPNRFVETDGQVAGLLHGPLAGRVGGDAAQMHPAGVMLDEHQDIQPFQQHRVHVQEVHREYPGGLGVQELPPRRARAARRRIDPRGTEDLIDGGRADGDSQLRQFTVDPAVSPQRVLFRQPNGQAGDAPGRRRPAGLAAFARVVPSRG